MAGVNYQLWIGTPHEMGLHPVKEGPSLPTVAKGAQSRLSEDIRQAKRFDSAAMSRIAGVDEQVRGLHAGSMRPGETKTWDYRLLGVTVVIEVKRTG